jgi:hypothetical protein
MPVCQACTAAKAKQKNLTQHVEHIPAGQIGGRLFLDMSTIPKKKGGPAVNAKNNWRMMVDERTQMKFSDFYETKDGMVEPTCEILRRWKQNGIPIKYIRCDNGGENLKLRDRANSHEWQLNLEFEFTARATPQHNHLAELAFATIANRGRALMHGANLPIDL